MAIIGRLAMPMIIKTKPAAPDMIRAQIDKALLLYMTKPNIT